MKQLIIQFLIPFQYMTYLFKKPSQDSYAFKTYGNYCLNRIAIILWLVFLFTNFVLYFKYNWKSILIVLFLMGMNSIIFSLLLPKPK